MQIEEGFEALRATLAPYPWAYTLVAALALAIAAWLANWITKHVLLRGLRKLLEAMPHASDVRHVKLRVVPRLANVVPALVVSAGVTVIPGLPEVFVRVVQAACQAFVVLTLALAVSRALDVVNELYSRRPDAQNKPIKGYLQVAKIVMFVLVAISIVATLTGARVLHLLTGMGAMMAVVLLIFQDTILSLVASVQISNDGRVRIGDWIEMPSQNADGDVIDIALHTVTVRNWDNTITTLPTKKLVSDAFKNWRGMSESGGRRIKRSLHLDQNSVHFLSEDERRKLRRFALLRDYLDGKEKDLEQWNTGLGEQAGEAFNRRRLTNVGTFRAYVERYLRAHPGIHQQMTLLVRQLQPDATGLPLEIYCFTNDVRWAVYENIQSDVFDHMLAILPEFGLRVFQQPAGADIRAAMGPAAAAGSV